jgi:hypothetical protein
VFFFAHFYGEVEAINFILTSPPQGICERLFQFCGLIFLQGIRDFTPSPLLSIGGKQPRSVLDDEQGWFRSK